MFKKRQKQGTQRDKKPYVTLHEIQDSSPEQNLQELEDNVTNAIAGLDSSQNGFFCTDEPFITRFDDMEILKYIRRQIPDFGINPGSTVFKQAIFSFLDNDILVQHVMERFDLDIKSLFGFMFRMEPSTFKGMFMKKVKEIVFGKQYFVSRRR